jgi:hypothetical protein
MNPLGTQANTTLSNKRTQQERLSCIPLSSLSRLILPLFILAGSRVQLLMPTTQASEPSSRILCNTYIKKQKQGVNKAHERGSHTLRIVAHCVPRRQETKTKKEEIWKHGSQKLTLPPETLTFSGKCGLCSARPTSSRSTTTTYIAWQEFTRANNHL